ncbi:MAG: SDR family oxidoreductase [Acidimicrobiia bacterium]
MAAIDLYGYAGKRAFVVGGATGIGAATAKLVGALGAEVVVADFADIAYDCAAKIKLDLRDPASIAAAVDAVAAIGPIDALFSCAGLSQGPDVLNVNCIGQRELIEALVNRDLMPRGSAIGMIASGAGLGWANHVKEITEFITAPGFDGMQKWVEANPTFNNYMFSKEMVVYYCAVRSFDFTKKGIRINALCPTSTDTPLARKSFGWLEYGTDYREAVGIDVADPSEQAYPFAFLCSPAASYISGTLLSVDNGLQAARATGTFTPAPPTPPSA